MTFLLPKPQRMQSKDYRRFIAQHGCLVPRCNRYTEAHHVVFDGQGRVGSKVNDTQCVPLCRLHHDEEHALGREPFEAKYGLDFHQIIIDLLTEYILKLTLE